MLAQTRSGFSRPSATLCWDAVFQLQPLNQLLQSCPSEARISQGCWDGVQKILATPSLLDPGSTSLVDFLGDIPAGSTIQVIGHSLGGALASVLALYLSSRYQEKIVQCHTFAAPTAGNVAFSEYFDNQLSNRAIRVFNTLDIVPYAWNAESLRQIESIYAPAINTPASLMEKIENAVSLTKDLAYSQPGNLSNSLSFQLTGSISEQLIQSSTALTAFDLQVDYQHNDAYIALLGTD